MFSHRQTFERLANEALLETQLNLYGRNESKLEGALAALQDPTRANFTGANLRPVTEQLRNRLALLYQYVNNFIFTYHSEMRLPEEKQATKTEWSYAIETNYEGEEHDYDTGDDDVPGITASASVMAITGRSSSGKEPCSAQLEFDRIFADKVNKTTKKKFPDKMSKCTCNISPPHYTKFGSVRFYPRYLKIQDIESRRQFIRTKRLCTNCLRRSHTSTSCRMRPLHCFYCKEAKKGNSAHNASLCENFNNEEFNSVKIKSDQQREAKEKERSEVEAYSIDANEGEELDDQSEDDYEEDCYQHCLFFESSLEDEIARGKEDGLPEDDLEVENFEVFEGNKGIRSIGQVLVGDNKRKVNLLSDFGSTGCFISHTLAKKAGLRKKRITNLKIESITGYKVFKTFVYELKIWNYKLKRFQTIEATGIQRIGRCRPFTSSQRIILNKVLKPAGMSSEDLSSATYGDVDVLLGASAAALQLYDHTELNALKKPINLRFFHSPLFRLPLAYGEVEGDWAPEEEVKMEIEKPEPEPKKTYSLNAELYKSIDLAKDQRIGKD